MPESDFSDENVSVWVLGRSDVDFLDIQVQYRLPVPPAMITVELSVEGTAGR